MVGLGQRGHTGQLLIFGHELSDELTWEHQVIDTLRCAWEHGLHGLLSIMVPLLTASTFGRALRRLGLRSRGRSCPALALIHHVDGRLSDLVVPSVKTGAPGVGLSPYIDENVESGVSSNE